MDTFTSGATMQIELLSRPAATAAKISLATNETVTCEVGAMIAMTGGFDVETTSRKRGSGKGGMLSGIKRMFAGENFFLNHFHANQANQHIVLGPKLMGDIVHHRLTNGALIIQGSSWLASTASIDIDATFPGLGRALFSGERLFWVKCLGQGDILLSSFGAIYEIDVTDSYVVDTGHIVAYEDSLQFNIGKAADTLLSSFLGGEGLVCKFTGQGKLYCQTHNPPSFGKLLGPKLKQR